jgi:hypothetical protein
MMTVGTICPNVRELEAFSSGYLTEDDIDVIADHLSHCSHCLTVLEKLSPSDAIIEAFRAQRTVPSDLLVDTEQVQRIIQAAKQLYS